VGRLKQYSSPLYGAYGGQLSFCLGCGVGEGVEERGYIFYGSQVRSPHLCWFIHFRVARRGGVNSKLIKFLEAFRTGRGYKR